MISLKQARYYPSSHAPTPPPPPPPPPVKMSDNKPASKWESGSGKTGEEKHENKIYEKNLKLANMRGRGKYKKIITGMRDYVCTMGWPGKREFSDRMYIRVERKMGECVIYTEWGREGEKCSAEGRYAVKKCMKFRRNRWLNKNILQEQK